jgi:Zn-dependent protease with chaperone function
MVVVRKLAAVCACLLPMAAGCASTPRDGSTPAGLLPSEEARVQRVVGTLSPQLQGRQVRVSVAPTAAPGAYAWPDGRVVLTRGLVRLLDDDELAAAVAHELGHLLADGHLHAAAALSGAGPATDVERRADSVGAALLGLTGYPADAMPRMLEKVAASPGTSNECRARLRDRIVCLRAN